MDNKEISVTNSTENKFSCNQYKWDIVFIAVPIIFIIFFPSGLVNYLCGRFNIHLGFVLFLSLFGAIGIFFALFLVNVIRIFRKNLFKKRLLILFEICLSILFFLSFFLVQFNWDSKDPFLCGYRDQITRTININEVQTWLKTNADNLSLDECPESLKKFKHALKYDGIREDEYGNNIIFYSRGGGFFHWGFVIGTEDMVYPISEIMKKKDEVWLLVKPGFYVFSQY